MRQVIAVARYEVKMQCKRPAFWAVSLFVAAFAFLCGSPLNQPGDILRHGVFYSAGYTFLMFSQFYMLAGAILVGDRVIRDRRLLVQELISATPLSPAQYTFGKYLGSLFSLCIPLLILLITAIIEGAVLVPYFNLSPGMSLSPYLLAFFSIGLPTLVWLAAVPLLGGTILRRNLWFSLIYVVFWGFYVMFPMHFPYILRLDGIPAWVRYFESVFSGYNSPVSAGDVALNWGFMVGLTVVALVGLLLILKRRQTRGDAY
jgi:ABC-type transport system involved in multi-copper enzyme maturation permease subunit